MADPILRPQLMMCLESFASLPQMAIPDRYLLRDYRQGDDAAWEFIIDDAFQSKYSFVESMTHSEHFRPERVKFICYGNTPVATASAWRSSDKETGYLHMVGVYSDHTGHGLGAQVSLAALQHMAGEGCQSAILNTDDFRIPAIKTYLKLGFIPKFVHENHPRRWTNILTAVGREDLLPMSSER